MQTLIHADIFFLISTIGFSIIAILMMSALWYVVRILRSVRIISQKLEQSVEHIGEETKEFFVDIRNSSAYRLLFGRSKRRTK